CVICGIYKTSVTACESEASLHEAFDVNRHAFGFCLADIFGVDLEDAKFDDEIRESFVANFCNELRCDLEDLHLHETLKRLFVEPHMGYLSCEICVDLENARFH